jgi:hypothetical protein
VANKVVSKKQNFIVNQEKPLKNMEVNSIQNLPNLVTGDNATPQYTIETPNVCTLTTGSAMTQFKNQNNYRILVPAVQGLGKGVCSILATTRETLNYSPAVPFRQSFEVVGRPQTITLVGSPLVPTDLFSNVLSNSSDRTVNAISTSGLPVFMRFLTPTVCENRNNKIRILSAGVCNIEFYQEGNSVFSPASISRSFKITRWDLIPQSIVVNLPATIYASSWNKTYPGGRFVSDFAKTTSGLVIDQVSASGNGCRFSGNALTFIGSGTSCLLTLKSSGDLNFAATQKLVNIKVFK